MNKTFPGSRKPSPRGANKNWRKANGKVVWPTEMKMFLVSRIKEHISVLDGDSKVDPQHKMRVWEQIYKALVRRGMPDSDVRTVKKVWTGLRASTIEVYRRMETKRRNTRNSVEISELQRAIHEVIDLSHKLKATGNSVMPMPMQVKIEMIDEADDATIDNGDCNLSSMGYDTEPVQLNETQREQQHLQLRSNPVVVLQPLEIESVDKELNDHITEEEPPVMPVPLVEAKHVSPPPVIPTPPPSAPTPPPSTSLPPASMPTPPPSIGETAAAPQPQTLHASPSDESPDCRRIYERIAEVELKIKLAQQRKEEQALEFEREIYARRLAILDSELKKKNVEFDFLVRSHQELANDPILMD